MDYISNSPQETKNLATNLASKLGGGEVLCLYGELGAGKTTFTAGIINYFKPGARVPSPTFIIVRHYEIQNRAVKNIFHVDLYRLEKNQNVISLGLDEFINKSDTLILIEWADYLIDFRPDKRIDLYFNIKNENQRLIKISRLSGIPQAAGNNAKFR